MNENYDFSCWVIKYDHSRSSCGKTYQKDSLVNSDNITVPLLWNHRHYGDTESLLGFAMLKHSDEGIYTYCTLFNNETKETVISLIKDRGSVSLSPYINNLTIVRNRVCDGTIGEVSLVPIRTDQHEDYYPVLKDEETYSNKPTKNWIFNRFGQT